MAVLSGGDRLLSRLRTLSEQPDSPTVKIGFLARATYPDGTSVAAVATFNEFGVPSRGQPARPFFRRMIAERGPTWPDAIAENYKSNNMDANRTLRQVGAAVAGQLRDSILRLTDPPLSPRTVRGKGFAKPLIATGHMLNSVDYEIEGE